jgi:hypothetical protein
MFSYKDFMKMVQKEELSYSDFYGMYKNGEISKDLFIKIMNTGCFTPKHPVVF